MTQLIYFEAESGKRCAVIRDRASITAELQKSGIGLAQWDTPAQLDGRQLPEQVLAAYGDRLATLSRERGYTSSDVITLTPDHPDRDALRKKFLVEHVHSEDEVRLFVSGGGAFYFHFGEKVQVLVGERGDLISVPAGTRHWFDAGPAPAFSAIRLFTNPSGWVAQYTGDSISDRIPRYEPGALPVA